MGLRLGTWDILRGFPSHTEVQIGCNMRSQFLIKQINKPFAGTWLVPMEVMTIFTEDKVTIEKPRQRLQEETRAVCVSVFLEDGR